MDNIFKNIDKRSKELVYIIQKKGPITKSELIEITKLKLSTLNRIINNLIDTKIIIEVASGSSTGGRKPSLFDINANMYYLIGVDISRTYIPIVITNLKMEIVASRLLPSEYKSKDINKIITTNIKELIKETEISEEKIIGIGFGIVEALNKKNEQGFSIYDYSNEKIKNELYNQIFETKKTIPISVDNGANAAAIGEYYFGSGRGLDNISYFNCGVGIRTGMISSGMLINNKEEAFAHMIIDMDGELCSCGNYGCIESYCSTIKIRDRLINEIKKGREIELNKEIEDITYLDVCNLAQENEPISKEIITSAAVAFGIGLSNYINMLSPQMIILSGPLVKHSKLFYEISVDIAFKKCYLIDKENIQIVHGGYFDGMSMAVGAAVMVFEQILKDN